MADPTRLGYITIEEMENFSQKCRNERIDSVKYCLMIMVIAGHIFSQKLFISAYGCSVLWKWIYIFHMPLFVFLSGFFSHKKGIKDYIQSCWRLFEPLLLFHLLMRGVQYLSTGQIIWKELLTPWWVLWYLLSLICWRTFIQFIPEKLLNNARSLFIIAFFICIISGLLPFGRFLSMQRTLAFFPFFFLGYCMKGRSIFIQKKYKPLCFAFLGVTIIFPLYFSNILGDLNQAQPYNNVNEMFSRAFVFCLSFPMSLSFINICPNTTWTSQQGKMTLYYYIYHAILIYFLMIIVSKLNLPTSFFAATIYTIAVTIGLGIISYLPGINYFTNPSTLLKKGHHLIS